MKCNKTINQAVGEKKNKRKQQVVSETTPNATNSKRKPTEKRQYRPNNMYTTTQDSYDLHTYIYI